MSEHHHDERDPVASPPHTKKIIRLKGMPDETGLSIRSVWEQVAEGTLPAPVQIGPRAVGWLADELEVWREQKRRERNERYAAGGSKDSLKDVDAPPKRPRGRPCKVPAAIELADAETDA